MDRHQAAYWLERTPEEAADFLARTEVAARLVGGFAKSAAFDLHSVGQMINEAGQGIASNPEARNALIGAGVGGLGGLGVGLMGNRKKSPWSTALTGAALGGLGGGLGTYFANHPVSELGTPSKAMETAQGVAKNQQVDAVNNAGLGDSVKLQLGLETPESLNARNQDAKAPPASGAAGPPDALASAMQHNREQLPQQALAAVGDKINQGLDSIGKGDGQLGVRAGGLVAGMGVNRAIDSARANYAAGVNAFDSLQEHVRANPKSPLAQAATEMRAEQAAGRARGMGLGSFMPDETKARAGRAALEASLNKAPNSPYAGLRNVTPEEVHGALGKMPAPAARGWRGLLGSLARRAAVQGGIQGGISAYNNLPADTANQLPGLFSPVNPGGAPR